MALLDDRRFVLALAALQAGDAVACAIPSGPVQRDLERLGVSEPLRAVIPVVKALSVIGLLDGRRRRPLGVLTSAALVLYFVLAIGAHIRARDAAWRYVAATAMLGVSVRAFRIFRSGAPVA